MNFHWSVPLWVALFSTLVYSCLPPATPYPFKDPQQIVTEATVWSNNLEAYIAQWTMGNAPDAIPDNLIPKGIADSKHFYLKNPDQVTPDETWAIRLAKPVNKDSLYAGIPDPKVTYLFLGTALAPFGSKLVIEGEFPHCRFFSIQATPPLNGKEYYAQRQFGTAEVGMVDVDIEPLPGNTNPFKVGANRNASNRKYQVSFELASGDPSGLNGPGHQYPYRQNSNSRKAAMLVYQGPLGYKTVAGTPLNVQGDWNLGALWIRIYEPDLGKDPLGGVPPPKVYFVLPNGKKYFIGSDFSTLQQRANTTIQNRNVNSAPNPFVGPAAGWYKSWGITRSMMNGVCQLNGWNSPDSAARVRAIDLGWTGRGEFQAPPGNIEPHATTNNYATYLGRAMTVQPGMVAVLTGRLPTFPHTFQGASKMEGGQVRYWSIIGIDQDPYSPLPSTTVHAISDDDVKTDNNGNYVIAYSRKSDRPLNATADMGVNWVDWGTQSYLGLLMRWVNVAPEWTFPYAPQENHLDFSHSDYSGTQYDPGLLGYNWRHGFMQCYLPKIHYMTRAEFEAIGNTVNAENIPAWIDSSYTVPVPTDARLGTVNASSVLDNSDNNKAANAIDGVLSTRWSSGIGAAPDDLTLDLGSTKIISGLKLHWDWVFFAKSYEIRISDNQNAWSSLALASNENGQVDLYKNLKDVKARYVQIHITEKNFGFSALAELEVYTNDCDCDANMVNTPKIPQPSNASLDIFPNPVQETLYFSSNLESPFHCSISDMSGSLCAQFVSDHLHQHIDVSRLKPGIYILQVSDLKNRQVFAKFVKT